MSVTRPLSCASDKALVEPTLTLVGSSSHGVRALTRAMARRGIHLSVADPWAVDVPPRGPTLLCMRALTDDEGWPIDEFNRLRPLEASRDLMFNSPSAVWIACHPELTARALEADGVPQPATRLLSSTDAARRFAGEHHFEVVVRAPAHDPQFPAAFVSTSAELDHVLRRARERPWFATSGFVVSRWPAADGIADVLVVEGDATAVRLLSIDGKAPSREPQAAVDAPIHPPVASMALRCAAAVGAQVASVRLLFGPETQLAVYDVDTSPDLRWAADSESTVERLATAVLARNYAHSRAG